QRHARPGRLMLNERGATGSLPTGRRSARRGIAAPTGGVYGQTSPTLTAIRRTDVAHGHLRSPPGLYGPAGRIRRGAPADLSDDRGGEKDPAGHAGQQVEPSDLGEDDDGARVDDPLLQSARRPAGHRASSSATSARTSSGVYWKIEIPARTSAS